MRNTRSTTRSITLLASSGLMLLGSTVSAQGLPLDRDKAIEILAASDRWIEIEGELQEDGAFLAKEVDILHPEDLANMSEIKVRGAIQNLDRRNSRMTVLKYKIVWNGETKIKDTDKKHVLSSKLQNDEGVKIKGQLQPDGTFLARSIQLDVGKVKDGVIRYKQGLLGPAKVLDASGGMLRVVSTNVRLRADCTFFDLPVQVEQPSP